MNVGLFGGTFDPIHVGHVDMIRQVCEHMQLDKVIFIPAYIPPHKNTTMTPYQHRLAMTSLAIKEDSGFMVSDYESKNPKPSYTFYTLSHFRETFPSDEFYYIMGADSFNSIESWHRWKELLLLSHFVVIDRMDYKLRITDTTQAVMESSPFSVYHLPLKTIPISSTIIRQQLLNHELKKENLNPAVYQYIQDNHLYMG